MFMINLLMGIMPGAEQEERGKSGCAKKWCFRLGHLTHGVPKRDIAATKFSRSTKAKLLLMPASVQGKEILACPSSLAGILTWHSSMSCWPAG